MIKTILWDVDATLLNFELAEKAAMERCFSMFEMGECTQEMLSRYSKINRSYWQRLERGELTKPEVLVGRFEEFFGKEGIPVEKAAAFNEEYQVRLGDTVFFHDNAYELIKELQGKVKQAIVTNGTVVAQERKLEKSGLNKLITDIFISDQIGAEKPSPKFFEKVWEELGPYKKEEVMIVGDSLTSDMQGGNNAGIRCCWYNPKGLKNESSVHVDYEITNLWQVKDILSNENL
ncbi:YjjG family noncanonical pyrimidine nucleotidase [Roseburia sp. 831b]|uniref:YjjG family noncanonical pyrimidine nucleotidase n=1 Tax=Roseburia sp. 831b TaxID=1261635 RepID=UPI0009515EED|nr:YjjG family noncanonical pyrimidine nucleotidase [Roseburia sp. 831b]WVK72771.1 YjjG family noncanonical pyrimidine nucleotidase [Roseburia sp. 831b]